MMPGTRGCLSAPGTPVRFIRFIRTAELKALYGRNVIKANKRGGSGCVESGRNVVSRCPL